MAYLGDFALGKTFDVKFTTIDATGAPITLGGSPVISAYPDNSTTELTAGITLTTDFDTRTGMHNIRVVATSGNGYASGSNYSLVITTGTVSGVSVVGYVVGHFSLEARSALRPTTADRTLDVAAGGEAGLDLDNTTGALAKGTEITGFNDLSAAAVNAEVVDALDTDTYAQTGQETPAATQTIRKMIGFLYKAWRNRKTETSTQYSLFNDDATTIDQKAAVSDSAGTTEVGEVATGP